MGLLKPKQQQGRKATPQEQQGYQTMVKQVLGFLAKPEVAAKLEEMVNRAGPEQALATVILQALHLVGKAAKQSGVDVATHTGKAAIKEIVMVMTTMMQASGLIENAQQSAAGVMQLIAEGLFGQQGQPQERQQQPMQAQQQQPEMMGA